VRTACRQGGTRITGTDVVADRTGDASPAGGVGASDCCCYGPRMLGARVQQREWLF
jgi:hypothetical protein